MAEIQNKAGKSVIYGPMDKLIQGLFVQIYKSRIK